jgi:uncharacterized damage-inducible protein DinB
MRSTRLGGGTPFRDTLTGRRSCMKLTELFLAELDREAPRTRRALEQVPTGRDDWKPHPKSMPLARLAGLVAAMPSWVNLIVGQDELELSPPGGGQYQQPAVDQLVGVHDEHVVKAREALRSTTDEYLMTTRWRLLMKGQTVMEQPRHEVLRDTFNHLAHHRGQLTVYLRLTDRTVPPIYGPTADDQRFL